MSCIRVAKQWLGTPEPTNQKSQSKNNNKKKQQKTHKDPWLVDSDVCKHDEICMEKLIHTKDVFHGAASRMVLFLPILFSCYLMAVPIHQSAHILLARIPEQPISTFKRTKRMRRHTAELFGSGPKLGTSANRPLACNESVNWNGKTENCSL